MFVFIDKNMLKPYYIFFGLLLILLLSSCRQEKAAHPSVLKADTLMEHYPDSALLILESIQEPARMKKADRALYALLLTQAYDKKDIIHTNDSLIRVAVDYYKDGSDNYRETQSLYYLARVYEDTKNVVFSIKVLLKAKDVLNKVYKNDRLACLINSSLANQYKKQGFYDKAMEAGKKAFNNCVYRNDPADIFFPLDYIGSIFVLRNENDSALHYYNKALEIAEMQSDSSWIAHYLSEISKIYLSETDFQNAYRYITKAIDFEPNEETRLIYYGDKGGLFYKMQEQDSARYYLIKSLESDDIETLYLSSLTLFEIEKDKGNYKKAVEYIEINNIMGDSIHVLSEQSEISKLLNEHAIDAYTKKMDFREKRKTARIILSSFVVFVALAFVFMVIDKRRKSHIIKLQKQLMHNRSGILKANQKKGGAKNRASELVVLKRICMENIQTSMELFKKNALYKEIRAMDRLGNANINLSFLQRNEIKDTIYEAFPDAFFCLRDLYHLTPDDAFCCILYALNLSNRTVSGCMGVAAGAIKTRKSRLKNKIDDELYAYLFSNQ